MRGVYRELSMFLVAACSCVSSLIVLIVSRLLVVHVNDFRNDFPMLIFRQIVAENVVPNHWFVELVGERYLNAIRFECNRKAADCDMGRLVIEYCRTEMEILETCCSRFCNWQCIPHGRAEPLLQRFNVVKHVFVRMHDVQVEFQHASDQQLGLYDAISNRPIFVAQFQWLCA